MKRNVFVAVAMVFCLSALAPLAGAQIPGPNVNMVAGTTLPDGDPFLQRQNEPSIAVSSRNACHLLGGSNDYRTVDMPGDPGDEEAKDAWLGVYKSYDCGFRWKTTLIPGYHQDPQGASSPLFGLGAGADPVVRAGSNGLFYYLGLAFDRGANGLSKVFVARYIDRNQEFGDSITYLNTTIVDSGNAGQFLDKPALAVDIPRPGAKTCSVDGQTFPGGNVYAVYSSFVGQVKNNVSRLYVTRSTDCGATWERSSKLSEGTRTNQGAAIAIDPATGNVYVAWRQFSLGSNQPDAILIARSTDGGKTFSKSSLVSTFAPFDQKTSATSFRSNAFPSIAVDGTGRIYIAWAARGFSALRPDPLAGDARIVVSTSANGTSWSMPRAVDNVAALGHQFMPSLVFAAGRLQLIYYDLREDATYGRYAFTSDGGLLEQRVSAGDLAAGHPEKVFWDYVADATPAALAALGPLQRRHTLDVRSAQALPGDTPQFTTATVASQRLSNYQIGGDTVDSLLQLQFNPPNLPLYAQGTVPFIGDYIDIGAQTIVPAGNGWRFNTAADKPPIFHAVWTDNRDVHPPVAPHTWADYTPPTSAYTNNTCVPGTTGMRNANIYTSRITPGLTLSSPGNAKPLDPNLPRAFAVVVQNTTLVPRSYRITLPPPGTTTASLIQFPAPSLPFPLLSLDVSVAPLSSVARTVYVRSSDPHAKVDVLVQEITAPAGTVLPLGASDTLTLNPDVTNPAITNPAITNETFNPAITNPAITNPAITNPAITNPAITNPAITNPAITNPAITNPAITNPAITNDEVSDPAITNPAITNSDIANGVISDVTWSVTNTGNTAAAYSAKLVLNQPLPPGFKKQLILHKTYVTPAVGANCSLGEQNSDVLVANILNPTFGDLSGIPTSTITDPAITNATLALAPGETGKITLRIVDPDRSNNILVTDPVTGKQISVDPAFDPTVAVTAGVVADAVNTTEATAGSTQPPVVISGGGGGVFLSVPYAGLANVPLRPVMTVQVRDNTGAVLPGVPVTLTLSTNPTGAALSGNTATTNATGMAAFPNLTVNKPGLGYVLQASSGTTVLSQSAPFNILQACASGGSAVFNVYTVSPGPDTLPLVARAANFTNDGHPDVALLQANSRITRLINNGAGGLQPGYVIVTDPSYAGASDLAVGDFDGDGRSDIAVVYSGASKIAVSLTNPDGTGTLMAVPIPSPANAIAAGDFDGDGRTDLAVVSRTADALYVLYGNGTASVFDAPVTFSLGPGSAPAAVAMGDVNGDGRADIVVATFNTGALSVYLGTLDRLTPALGPFPVGGSFVGIDLHDMTGDGKVDAVLADSTGQKLTIVRGAGDGSFGAATTYAAGGTPSAVIVGDFDSDGHPDMAAAIPAGNAAAVLFSDGAGGFKPAVSFPTQTSPVSVAVADLDGNGRADLIITDNGHAPSQLDNVVVMPGACGALTADVRVSYGGSPASQTPGGAVTFTATVTNLGPFAAHNVTLSETFSSGTIVNVFNPTGGMCSLSSPVNCAIGTLASGASVTITTDVTMGSSTIVTQAVATADETDLLPGNNSATAVTNVVAPQTYVVSNANDSGPGSLRQAILNANANTPAVDTITFALPFPYVITLASPLPQITDAVNVDGSSLPGYGGLVRVTVAAGGAFGGSAGFDVVAPNNGTVIRGLSIVGWAAHGIHLGGGSAIVAGNYIGLAADGVTPNGNGEGVFIDGSAAYQIGGSSAADRNVISGNAGHGVDVAGAGTAFTNHVGGNYIGTNANGGSAVANGGSGVYATAPVLVGGFGTGNTISGNGQNGVELAAGADGSAVQFNNIGTDAGGVWDVGNAFDGVRISGANNTTIGGVSGSSRNVISGNDEDGVHIDATSDGTTVSANYVGLNATGTGTIPNGVLDAFFDRTGSGVLIYGPNTTVGRDATSGNVIAGNGTGVTVDGASAVNASILGNIIGLDAAGTTALSNRWGVFVSNGAANAQIGGNLSPYRNTISGNALQGIYVVGTGTTATVRNNYIGTDASGSAAIANTDEGVYANLGAQVVVDGNVVSGNGLAGIRFDTDGNKALNNKIGLNAAGSAAVANGQSGISIGGSGNQALTNTIAFNADNGVTISGTSATKNELAQNSIYSNGHLGIDLGGDGVTANDGLDADTGANQLQNFPTVDGASTTGSISGFIDSSPGGTFRVDLYVSPTCGASGYGEGKAFLGSIVVITDGSGHGPFSGTFAAQPAGTIVTATATDTAGNTSEFSACQTVVGPAPLPLASLSSAAAGETFPGVLRQRIALR